MKILDIYHRYQIMPQLVEHQLKVAAVGKLICDHTIFTAPLSVEEKQATISACLLHDMGNIVKFNFQQTAELNLAPSESARLDFWEGVKQNFVARYGSGSHQVTTQILDELGVSPRVRELADAVGFSQGPDNAKTLDFGKKICAYADMRVMPHGVVALEVRMADLRVRYKGHPEGEVSREAFERALREIEKQIFAHCNLKPEDVTEASVAEVKEALKNFEIKVDKFGGN